MCETHGVCLCKPVSGRMHVTMGVHTRSDCAHMSGMSGYTHTHTSVGVRTLADSVLGHGSHTAGQVLKDAASQGSGLHQTYPLTDLNLGKGSWPPLCKRWH